MSEVRIYRRPLAAVARRERRGAEREAVARLVVEAFGADAVMEHMDDGRPYVVSCPEKYVSVSHCTDECVLAVSDSPVGVDVETFRQQLAGIAIKFLTPAEAAHGPHDMDALMRYWTAKEAVFKCAGIKGLVISEIEVSDDFSRATVRGCEYRLEYFCTPGKVMAIAGMGEDK